MTKQVSLLWAHLYGDKHIAYVKQCNTVTHTPLLCDTRNAVIVPFQGQAVVRCEERHAGAAGLSSRCGCIESCARLNSIQLMSVSLTAGRADTAKCVDSSALIESVATKKRTREEVCSYANLSLSGECATARSWRKAKGQTQRLGSFRRRFRRSFCGRVCGMANND
jgi:hypothetical protein